MTVAGEERVVVAQGLGRVEAVRVDDVVPAPADFSVDVYGLTPIQM